jgi:hypothetical protein
MRILVTFLVMIVSTMDGLGQERAKIDMDGSHTKTAPSITTERVNMPKMTAPAGPKPLWGLDLLPMVKSSPDITLYEIHLINGSTSTLMLPVSQDGVGLATACPEHAVSSLTLALTRKDERFSRVRVEQFYGCEEQPDSFVYLKPGEWISFTGRVQRADIKTQVRAEAILSRIRYTNSANGMVADQVQTANLSSPWQSLPN